MSPHFRRKVGKFYSISKRRHNASAHKETTSPHIRLLCSREKTKPIKILSS
nr:MAG TPA: hypothetical protein [Caudoviricetes sp.]